MFGDYVLHYPTTDFAVSLLVVAALLDIGGRVWKRTAWEAAADVLLFLGFAGAIASVGSGLWLVAAGDHGHARELDLHHWFAYAATGVAALAVPLRTLQRRRPHLATVKTVALAVSAALGPIRWPARPSTRQPP